MTDVNHKHDQEEGLENLKHPEESVSGFDHSLNQILDVMMNGMNPVVASDPTIRSNILQMTLADSDTEREKCVNAITSRTRGLMDQFKKDYCIEHNVDYKTFTGLSMVERLEILQTQAVEAPQETLEKIALTDPVNSVQLLAIKELTRGVASRDFDPESVLQTLKHLQEDQDSSGQITKACERARKQIDHLFE